MEKILIIGASGHAKVIVDIIEKQNKFSIFGFLDTFKQKGEKLFNYNILGTEDDLNDIISQNEISGCFIAIGDNFTRKTMASKMLDLNPNIKFINAIHPSAVIGKNVKLGQGNAIMAGTVINSDSIIGSFCILNTNSFLEHDGIMEDYSSISSGVRTGGNLTLMEGSAICIGATVLENIVIEKDTVIGAGSLVNKNVPSLVVVYGVPAKIIRSRKADDKYLFGDRNCLQKK